MKELNKRYSKEERETIAKRLVEDNVEQMILDSIYDVRTISKDLGVDSRELMVHRDRTLKGKFRW